MLIFIRPFLFYSRQSECIGLNVCLMIVKSSWLLVGKRDIEKYL